MSRVYWFVGVLSVVLVLAICYVMFFLGGGYYLRALILVKNSPKDAQEQMRTDLFATDNKDAYGGVLAGVLGDRVLVWGQSGLRAFQTDEYSVYFYKDICSERARVEVEGGVSGVDLTELNKTLDMWQAKLQRGDYIVVTIAKQENGGVVGNLREAHAYNYYPFEKFT